MRVSDRFAAVVVDYEVDFRKRCGLRGLHCETVPGMFPLSAEINDRSSLPMPWRKVPYKFGGEKERRAILDFFDRHLRDAALP